MIRKRQGAYPEPGVSDEHKFIVGVAGEQTVGHQQVGRKKAHGCKSDEDGGPMYRWSAGTGKKLVYGSQDYRYQMVSIEPASLNATPKEKRINVSSRHKIERPMETIIFA